MPTRALTRFAVALLLGLVAVPALTTPAPAGVAPPDVIVAARTICPGDQFEITITNPGVQTYQVEVVVRRFPDQIAEVTALTIDPAETEQVVLDISGTPMDVFVSGDGDFPDQELGPVFLCTRTVDFAATTPMDTAVVIDLQGPCSGDSDTPHGTVEFVDTFTIRYIPDPGFVGVDSFPYSCTASGEQQGTVTVTVTPAQAPPPAAPVPEEPTFTG